MEKHLGTRRRRFSGSLGLYKRGNLFCPLHPPRQKACMSLCGVWHECLGWVGVHTARKRMAKALKGQDSPAGEEREPRSASLPCL